MPSRRTLAASALLRDHGPLDLEELGRLMAGMGATRARNATAAARETVRWSSRFHELRDGRWMDRVAVLDAAVLRHRVTRHERRISALRMDPDLSVMGSLLQAREVRPVEGSAEVTVDWIRDRRIDPRWPIPERFLRLPYAMGRSLRPGGMVAVVVTGDAFDLVSVTESPPRDSPDPVLQDVAAELLSHASRVGFAGPIPVEQLLFEALARAPDLLRSSCGPVGEMLRRCDLASHRDLVATPLTEWDLHDGGAAVWDLIRDLDWPPLWSHGPWLPLPDRPASWYDVATPVEIATPVD